MRRGEPSCSCWSAVAIRGARLMPIVLFAVLFAGPAALAVPVDQCDPTKIDSGCPSDGNPCTNDVCNPTTRTCEYTPKTCVNDNLCQTGTCNPSNGQCEFKQIYCPQDSNLCTFEQCNPTTGSCESTAPRTCPIDDPCRQASCNPSSGLCDYSDVVCPDDGNLCTAETCNHATGRCESGSPKTCSSIDNLCQTGSCNPTSGQCEFKPVTCAADDNLCTTETCDPATGRCESGSPKDCASIDDLCRIGSCSPTTGDCVYTPVTCAQDDDLCTVEACVPATGHCAPGAPRSCDQDRDTCTTEVCDKATGSCTSVPANPTPVDCAANICRTPGFWGTHAGVEKSGSRNITQAVITAGGGVLDICGEKITNTVLSDDESAVEGICVSMKESIVLQLARQLTAASLNCIMSNGVADCSATPLYAPTFSSCNAICAASGSSRASVTECVNELDCLNNGGTLLGSGFCQTGTCAGDGSTPCSETAKCGDGSACTPLRNNCHDQLLTNPALGLSFEPPGNAGSSDECNAANKSACTVIGTGQTKCLY